MRDHTANGYPGGRRRSWKSLLALVLVMALLTALAPAAAVGQEGAEPAPAAGSYDRVGILHNTIVEEVIDRLGEGPNDHRLGTLWIVQEAALVGCESTSRAKPRLDECVDRWVAVATRGLLAPDSVSHPPAAQPYLDAIEAVLTSDGSGSVEESLAALAAIEEDARLALSRPDQELVLSGGAIARHSLAFWAELSGAGDDQAPSRIKKKAHDVAKEDFKYGLVGFGLGGWVGAIIVGAIGSLLEALDPAESAGPSTLTVDEPSPVAGTYPLIAANFGGDPGRDVSGPLKIVEVLSGPLAGTPGDGCEPLVDFPPGSIAVVVRGGCSFAEKTEHAQAAGAIALIVTNNEPGPPVVMEATDADHVTIPAAMVSQEVGHVLHSTLGVGTTATLSFPWLKRLLCWFSPRLCWLLGWPDPWRSFE